MAMDDDAERLLHKEYRRTQADRKLAQGPELREKLADLEASEKAIVFRIVKQIRHLKPEPMDGCYHLQIDMAAPPSPLAHVMPKTRRFTEGPLADMGQENPDMSENEAIYRRLLDKLVALDVLAPEGDVRRKRIDRDSRSIFIRLTAEEIKQLSGLTGVRTDVETRLDPHRN